MSVEFEIEEYFKGEESTFYTIKLKGEAKSETEKFFEEMATIDIESTEFIAQRIEIMAEKTGCRDNFFKLKESSFFNNLCALSKGELRLYCLRYGNVAVVLGGGGIKPEGVASYQEIPELDEDVKILEKACELIDERIKEKEIQINDNSLSGNFKFIN